MKRNENQWKKTILNEAQPQAPNRNWNAWNQILLPKEKDIVKYQENNWGKRSETIRNETKCN